jgi:DNA methylase.
MKSKVKIVQMPLFEIDNNGNGQATTVLADPAFSANKVRPIHRWVPWIAGFSSEFVRDAITRFVDKSGVILDPFAGVGTTLVEAQLMGHKAYGFEINPYAALASKMKTEAFWMDSNILENAINKLVKQYKTREKRGVTPLSTPPEGFKTRSEFYSPAVLKKVLLIQDLINETEDIKAKNMLRLAFASTMVRFSNYSYEPSLGRRRSSGKKDIIDFPVLLTIEKKSNEMLHDIKWLQSSVERPLTKVKVVNESVFTQMVLTHNGEIDAVVTSPPYLNNYHYNRNTRPQVYWLGYAKSPEDMKKLEINNFGKYWQTVRELDRMSLEFKLPNSDLNEVLDAIAKVNPDRGTYGGLGWANYAVSYFNDCNKFAKILFNLLRRGGGAAVVLGNSIIQGHEIATDRYFGEICKLNGLRLIGIEIPRSARVGNSIIKSSVRVVKAGISHHLYESIVVLQKP